MWHLQKWKIHLARKQTSAFPLYHDDDDGDDNDDDDDNDASTTDLMRLSQFISLYFQSINQSLIGAIQLFQMNE